MDPVIWWIRRDLRLQDNPALCAALAVGGPVIPVFIHDEVIETLGAAPRWRFGEGLAVFSDTLSDAGSRLILRRGPALEVLRALVAETGARSVHWSRAYDPDQIARDTAVKAGLSADGVSAASHAGHLLFEPWSVSTKTGGFYKVYTPMWKSVRDHDPGAVRAAPGNLSAPELWPASDDLATWDMGGAMNRGAAVVARHAGVGASVAADRLAQFMAERVQAYDSARDLPGVDGTSRLSENLTYGEISPRQCWIAGRAALEAGAGAAETFLKELVWREFAYHLVYHTPRITTRNWREDWDSFGWRGDNPDAERWRRGMTGVRFVDAAMREMYVTGTMHNRGRMIVASYLTKHLLTDWRVGRDWFDQCLIDWDPASNAMGWQWAAGSGPDAAPYFRIFNPDTQLEKFDRNRVYQHRFLAELFDDPAPEALSFFDAVPRAWGLSPDQHYPEPVITLQDGRDRALAAYAARKTAV